MLSYSFRMMVLMLFFYLQQPGMELKAQSTYSTIDDVFETAISLNHRLKTVQYEQQLSEYDKKLHQSSHLPSLRLTGSSEYFPALPVQLVPSEFFGGNPGEFAEIRFGQPFILAGGIELSMPVFHLENWRRSKGYDALIQQSQFRAAFEEEQLKIELIKNYYTYLLLKEWLPYAEELYNYADSLHYFAVLKTAENLLSPVDQNRASNLKLKSGQLLQQTRAQLERAAMQLQYSMGLNPENKVTFTEQLSAINTTASEIRLRPVEAAPGYQVAKAGRLAADRIKDAEAYNYLPNVYLTGRYTMQQQSDPFNENDVINRFSFGSVGLNLAWNIYNGNAQNIKRQTALIQQTISNENLESTQKEIQHLQLQWWSHYAEAKAMEPVLAERKEKSLQNLNTTQLRYEEGLSTLEAYFQVYQEYTEAVNDHLQNLVNLHVYKAFLSL